MNEIKLTGSKKGEGLLGERILVGEREGCEGSRVENAPTQCTHV